MGETEHFDRETLADGPATVADHREDSACTVGDHSADWESADLSAEHGDGEHATLRSGAVEDDVTRGPADLAAVTCAGAAAETATVSSGKRPCRSAARRVRKGLS